MRPTEAEASCREALPLRANYPDAHLDNALRSLGMVPRLSNPSSRHEKPAELFRVGPPIKNGAVLGFLAVRNEALRLPAVLDHHRHLGIDQFVIVDTAERTEEFLDEVAELVTSGLIIVDDVHVHTYAGGQPGGGGS